MATFIESEISNRRSYKSDSFDEKRRLLSFRTICNAICTAAIIFMAISLPIIFYSIMFSEDYSMNKENVCLIDNIYRVSCGAVNISEKECFEILCCFSKNSNSCYHSEPSSYYYQRKDSDYFAPSQKKTPFGLPSAKKLDMLVKEDESQIMSIIISDNSYIEKGAIHKNFSHFDVIENENDKLAVTVLRKGTKDVLLTTLKGPLSFSKEYSEITIQLTNNNGLLFGLGELNIELSENTTLTKTIYKNKDDHNTLPIFMAYKDGKYHAASIIHEGLLEISVLPSLMIVLRNVGGKNIEIKVIDGQTPRELYKKLSFQHQNVTNIVPEWALGVHICREEPATDLDNLLNQYEAFIMNKMKRPFSYESDCIHDDLLLHLIAENYTPEQTEKLFTKLKLKEKFMLSFPPQVPIFSSIYNNYKTMFLRNVSSGEVFIGKYKGFDVVYPDYGSKNIEVLISAILNIFKNISLNGITFSSSWPQDDNYEAISTKPYMNKNIITALSKTIPWDLKEQANFHVKYHNDYGSNLKSIVKNHFSDEKFYLSPVSDINTFQPLIIQNVNISWTNLKHSIRTSLYNSLFGNQMTSVPVCGSNDDYDEKIDEDLCLRWYLFAATMPLFRISARKTSRDPSNLNTLYTSTKVIEALEKRKQFIPYYRNIMNNSEPVVRPMFYNFPNDANTQKLDEQYMIGEAILVAHPLLPDVQEMRIYLPSNQAWYELWGGSKYLTKKHDKWIKLSVVMSDWVSFILEGNILPLVKKSEKGDLEIDLIIAPHCTTDCRANGSILLYYNGIDVSVKFSSLENEITIDTTKDMTNEVKSMIKSVRFTKYKDPVPDNYIIK